MRRLRWLFILIGTVFIAGVWYFFGHEQKPQGAVAASKPNTSGQSQTGAPGGPPVPVVAGVVQKRDVPIYLDGIGTVQAYNTVTVHPQISGILTKVAFREGQDVKKGDLLAVIDPRPYQATLDGALAKKDEDTAQLNNAKVLLGRDTDLFKKGAIDHQTYDTQRFLADQLDATVRADQAAIDSAQTQLSYTQITAPFDGRCGIRLVDQGNLVTPTSSLLVITQLKPISVLFTLPQQNVLEINQAAAKGQLKVIALDSAQSQSLEEGTLEVVDNQINTTTGTIQLKANFQNENLRLWPGQFVNARLLVSTRQNGLVVPASVIQRGPEGTYAYVITSNKTAEMRPVKVGQIDGGQALIDSGLQAGEQVVVDGQYRLQPGARVVITQPPQRANAGQLSEADETVPETQSAIHGQTAAPERAEKHQRQATSSGQPEPRVAPAIPNRG
jgi:membrane fusion protein, multidrug efflux system